MSRQYNRVKEGILQILIRFVDLAVDINSFSFLSDFRNIWGTSVFHYGQMHYIVKKHGSIGLSKDILRCFFRKFLQYKLQLSILVKLFVDLFKDALILSVLIINAIFFLNTKLALNWFYVKVGSSSGLQP